MTRALSSDDPAVRARAVTKLEDRADIGRVLKVLRSDPAPVVRKWAVNTLAKHYGSPTERMDPPVRLGDIDSVVATALMDALSNDEDTEVRSAAASALGRMRWRDALPSLFAAAGHDQLERPTVIEAIGRIADPESCRRLTAMWEINRPGARDDVAHLHVMSALIKIGEPAIPYLELTLKDGSAPARTYAAETLGQIGGAEAKRLLQIATGDLDIEVREQAARSLAKLNGDD